MKTLKCTFVIALITVSGGAFAAQSSGLVVSHHEVLQNLRLADRASFGAQPPKAGASLTMQFDAMGRTFDLQLNSNKRLFSGDSQGRVSPRIQLYRGQIQGVENSWARIVIADGIPRGMIWDGSEMYALEAPGDSGVDSDGPVIYRIADTYIQSGTMTCGAGEPMLSGNGRMAYNGLMADLGAIKDRALGATKQLNIGAIGDSAFVSDMIGAGQDPQTALLTRLNNVDGIFTEYLGVQLAVQAEALELFDDANDPFSDTLDAGDLLDELADYRRDSPDQQAQGLTHMYTGRNFEGTTVGIAYRGAQPSSVLCSATSGAGISEGNFGAFTDSLIAAHEIGHNFGAEHDGQPGSCEDQVGTFIMSPSISTVDDFSPCSITQMQIAVDAATCFVVVPGVDMLIQSATPDLDVFLGNSATANFDVDNIGTDDATGVNVDIIIPDQVDFVSASTTVGICTNGAGTVNCQLGGVAAGSSVTVGVSTISSSVGSSSFDAAVTADEDDSATNDQASAQLTVNPAVDLVLTIPSTVQLTLNQSTSVTVPIQNDSTLDASNVTLNITVAAGIRVDSAAWDIGDCTITGLQIDCTAASLDSQSTTAFTFGVTGVQTGDNNFDVLLASDIEDRDPASNTGNGTISVNEPVVANNGGDGDSGGGATDVPMLLLILTTLAARRRRAIK